MGKFILAAVAALGLTVATTQASEVTPNSLRVGPICAKAIIDGVLVGFPKENAVMAMIIQQHQLDFTPLALLIQGTISCEQNDQHIPLVVYVN
jgi:hypothetical protein